MRGLGTKLFVPFAIILVGAGVSILNIPRLGALSKVSFDEANQPSPYRALPPIKSGDLTIFPVARASGSAKVGGWQYLTLDEGLKSGEVVVTEAGRVRGLVRNRRRGEGNPAVSGDQVNELVLVNNSSKPLILLAGEIVTGGKQDRVIAKDRIVPPQADPINLSVFCIEPGRWVESSAEFGAAGKKGSSFMVQPAVRHEAMVAQDQQKVWNAVGGAIHGLAAAAPQSSSHSESEGDVSFSATTSYAKTMQEEGVARKVDEASDALLQQREQILAQLRKEDAVGVVAAVRGEIVWADIFADPELLQKYWTKLVRSYAAETLTSHEQQDSPATQEDAQRFLNEASTGHETSDGEVGVYRYSEMHAGNVVAFTLRALLPGTNFDVHISKAKTEGASTEHARD